MKRSTPFTHPPGVPLRTPVHPGRFLSRHYLGPLALSQSAAARLLGVSRRRLHELVSAERAMSPDTAIRCALHFGVPATTWLALQADWDSYHAWKALRREALAAGALSALVLHSGGLPRTPRQAAHAALA